MTSGIKGAAGVVVSYKIPILVTRVRFPGGALPFPKAMVAQVVPKNDQIHFITRLSWVV